MSAISMLKNSLTQRWARARRQHHWLDHLLRAWQRFQHNNGSQYAAAITYFSFLALFPLILLGVSVVGFVLSSHQHLQTELFNTITSHLSGSFGDTVKKSIDGAIKARTGVGIVGLVGVLLSGLGWIGNLRAGIDAVWGVRPKPVNFVRSRVANLLVLGGLGLGIVVSLGLSTVGVAVTDQLVNAVGAQHVTGVRYLVKAASIVLGLVGDMIIFGWVLVRLPRSVITGSIAVRGALLAAVGFEILKIVGTYTISKSAHSPTLGPFASILAVLIWIQLVVRYLLVCAAWMATAAEEAPGPLADPRLSAVAGPGDARSTASSPEPLPGPSPLAVGASIFTAGAAVGAWTFAGATAWARRRR